ncbi:sigma-54 dependent transcriptional regulator [Ottowia sp.]|uniref:sigma-54-dependent transcriptional regulator n=1 Tax=Ottowia sp. TaxID=1898956 RepID=UPI002B7E853B|nr:sigma-54 dependent transcriptional regulator [Ottowia sp.]MCP5259202.1 sigma-54-dependent Fis family transcriptional regulator [Burkholderiaceae bacterium]HRW71173.1 sigma-54 dependent transcriptional regulator [Ottowia sp.]
MSASLQSPGQSDTPRLLVVDDEPDLRTLYELTLLREGYEVQTAGSLAEAREFLAGNRYDLLITDMRLPDGEGLALLRELASDQRPERCIMITAYGSAENAVQALKAGAFDYLTKPVDLKQFRNVVASALHGQAGPAWPAASDNAGPAEATPAKAQALERPDGNGPGSTREAGSAALSRLVGDSPPMQRVKQSVAKVASSMAPVLVHGESGTGKELVARAIHACSHRGDGPFVPVNCGAIPENLLEAEFFGALKGSYTGAAQDRPGFFQAASGGTLFLDEIGDLPLAMQAKLLRAIQERKVRPLGATLEEPVDARIVSATHRDLGAEVHAGRFRQDLFYRLNVIEIAVPPLRHRREDLPQLCEALLARIARESGAKGYRLSAAQLESVSQLPLEGNVRELENVLHRAVALGDVREAGIDDAAPEPTSLPAAPSLDHGSLKAPAPAMPAGPSHTAGASVVEEMPIPSDLEAWLAAQEKQILIRALEETGFNRTAAAAKLGLNLRQIRYRMSRLGITDPSNTTDDDDDGG